MRFLSLISLTFLAATSCVVLAAPTAYSSSVESSHIASLEKRGQSRLVRRVFGLSYGEALRSVQEKGAGASTAQLARVYRQANVRGDEPSVTAINKAMKGYDPQVHTGRGKVVLKKTWDTYAGDRGVQVKTDQPKLTKAQIGKKAAKVVAIGVLAVAGIALLKDIASKNDGVTESQLQQLIQYAVQNPSQADGIVKTLQKAGATPAQIQEFQQQVMENEPQTAQAVKGVALPSGVATGDTGTGTSTAPSSNANSKRSLKDLD